VNFVDRVRVFRRIPSSFEDEVWRDSLPCRFEVLSAAEYAMWAGSAENYELTKAHLHLPLTLPDFPETGYDFTDYTFEMLSPILGWIRGQVKPKWQLGNKKFTRTHVTYLLALKEA
jgi:hypothetical protein